MKPRRKGCEEPLLAARWPQEGFEAIFLTAAETICSGDPPRFLPDCQPVLFLGGTERHLWTKLTNSKTHFWKVPSWHAESPWPWQFLWSCKLLPRTKEC
ncbi:hypothetical protein CapIbe_018540 [Capra ibex]